MCGYLDYVARGEVHLYDKHDGDPDDGANDHEPAQNHGPGGVGVVLICHHLPLVQAEDQDALCRQANAGNAGQMVSAPLTFNTGTGSLEQLGCNS